MWSKHKKLEEWVSAGLMTEGQSDAIHAYETAKKRGGFGRNLVGLSLFAILIGVLSIIASNWNVIPGGIKIGVHVLLNLSIGLATLQADRMGKELWREGLAFAFFGLTLTLIILIGQVFQLEGSHAGALLLWMIITLPFMLVFSQTRLTAVPWMIAFLGTLYMNAAHYLEDLSMGWQNVFYHGIAVLLPLAMMADGSSGLFRKIKPVWADIFVKTGCVLLVISVTVTTIFWGEMFGARYWTSMHEFKRDYGLQFWVYGVAFAGIGIHALIKNFYRDDPVMKAGALFAAVSVLICALPYLVPSGDNSVLKAIVFIAYWIFIGWLGQGLGRMRLVSLAITLIAIRIFAIYVELFGSLMDTGIGLIVGGIVMLCLIAGARRLNRHLVPKGGAA